MPIECLIETVFCFELTKIGIAGAAGAIVAVSLAVGFLTLPIYNKADAVQKHERDTQALMANGIKRIKETFSGDERFMMLQTYYREHRYSPIYALRSSLSVIIEVPFFIAAYHFLSHCPSLQGVSCGILHDLGKPDGLIAISVGGGHSLTFNLLPILMTAINAVSSAVYLKGFTIREKAQTYCLALIFLVLLYNSPSGLVLYWTLNNLFSLAKNMVQRWVKRPRSFVHIFISVMLLFAAGYMLVFNHGQHLNKRVFAFVSALVFALLPVLFRLWKMFLAAHGGIVCADNRKDESVPAGSVQIVKNSGFALFVLSAAALALLLGLVLPASVIATDAVEFSFVGDTACPLYYVYYSFCLFLGAFLLWPLVIYRMFGARVKAVMHILFALMLIMALLDVYVFRYDYGFMDVFFKLDNHDVLSDHGAFYNVLPILLSTAIAILLYAMRRRHFIKYCAAFCAVICIAQTAFSAIKMHSIMEDYKKCAATRGNDETVSTRSGITPDFHLSRTGRNVVVLFSDRAISSFFPYILKQFLELNNKFSGFVYYPNTLSFGRSTHRAIGAMVGGYEYTQEEKNKRTNQTNREKYNESISVMPKLFLDAGFHVTISEPQESEWRFNDDAYRRYKDIETYYFGERFIAPYLIERGDTYRMVGEKQDVFIAKHILGFCIMQSSLPLLRRTIYNSSWYFQTRFEYEDIDVLRKYAYLYFLDALTDTKESGDTYTFIGSPLTHDPALMQEPYYIPNSGIDESKATCGEYKHKLLPSDVGEQKSDLTHYHVNAAAMLLFSKWFDCLRTMGVYDNTRIIIVADHGCDIPTPAFGESEVGKLHANYNPLLLVKDFDTVGAVRTDKTFMTNADTLLLATHGLAVSDTNPYTGKRFSDTARKDAVQIYTEIGNDEPNRTQTKLFNGYSVSSNIFDENNWKAMENGE